MQLYYILTLFLSLTFATSCPPRESLYPCVCSNGGVEGTKITCSGVEHHQVLKDAVFAARLMGAFFSFVIENGNFLYLPHNLFKSVKFSEFEMKSTTLMALTDTDLAFEGLEEDLHSLYITDCLMLNEWDWSALRKLENLMRLQVDVDLQFIPKDIEEINAPKLVIINFDNNELTQIYDTAFVKFKNLGQLSLKNNLLSEMKRSMLPRPANLLWELNLSHNKITKLPSDMFEDMPRLLSLNLASNLMLTLSEDTFSKVWIQLTRFDASGNHLRCDCRLSWILETRSPRTTTAVCDKPLALKGKSVVELIEVDIWC